MRRSKVYRLANKRRRVAILHQSRQTERYAQPKQFNSTADNCASCASDWAVRTSMQRLPSRWHAHSQNQGLAAAPTQLFHVPRPKHR
jgi:hypothetical protein